MKGGDSGPEEKLPKGTVLIAGGGPVGLLVATVLARYGVSSVVTEKNKSSTKWPKMDLTNARSMEIFRRLGLADDLRHIGVPSNIPQPVLFSTGLGAEMPLAKWSHPSVDEFRSTIRENNDGTQPLEPWQRVSQVVFEAWLRDLCVTNPLIDLRYGYKVESVHEHQDLVRTTLRNVDSDETTTIISDFVAGCDGASSKVRQTLQIPLDGGPLPSCVLLVHFKSKDLSRLHKQGQFWHIFFHQPSGLFTGAVIAQDEVDTWTTHMFLPLDADEAKIDSHQAVYDVLGGLQGSYPIKIDEILVRSVWRPSISVARKFASTKGRVFIAGDAAHQLIPTGGYGMNTGIGDGYDLSWKLAAVINGEASKELLDSYDLERRPVALRNSEHSGIHMNAHLQAAALLTGHDVHNLGTDSEEGREVRRVMQEHYQKYNGENTDFGIEMDYRYSSPIIFFEDGDTKQPAWSPSKYTPTTWPGARPPHLFLKDGTAIFDHFHPTGWTLVNFSNENCGWPLLIEAAQEFRLPLKHLQLPGEEDAKKLWERQLVLVRPDGHVCWRGESVASIIAARDIVETVTGRKTTALKGHLDKEVDDAKPTRAFTATLGLATQVDDYKMEKMGAFQKG